MAKILTLGLRLLAREWRSGELRILMLALMIAVSGATTIILFADRLHRTMESQAAEFLAADLMVRSHAEMPAPWLAQAGRMGLRQARTTEFASVILHQEQLLLAGVKAVSDGYPLRGRVRTTRSGLEAETVASGIPAPGEAWAEQRVLSSLGLRLGDRIEVGEARFRISRIVTYEPDRRGDFYSLSPRIFINQADLAATRILQPGSHVHHFLLFAGPPEQVLAFKRWLKPRLEPGQRLVDIHEDRPELGSALTRAERYLGLASIIVVLIAGVAIAMAARRYSERHYDMTAVLRCLGAKQADLLQLYLLQLLGVGLVASLLGYVIGWFAQEGLLYFLRDLLPKALAPPAWGAWFLSLETGMITLLGFALPPLLRLRRVSPLRVLRRDLMPAPASVWAVYGFGLAVIVMLLWRYTGDVSLTVTIVAASVAFLALSALLALGLIKAVQGLLPWLGLPWKLGLRALNRAPGSTVSQILAFSITLMAMVVILLVRSDLIVDWRNQLPEQAPNYFVLNIFPGQWEDFQQRLHAEGVATGDFFPITRGRLVQVNGGDVQHRVSQDSQGERAINRDLSLTWSTQLPAANRIVKGQWWQPGKGAQVSVEQELAQNLKIGIGDELGFVVGSERFVARVTSLRSVRWDSMSPNFYMIFSPGTLADFPSTYITSFFLPDRDKPVLGRLVEAFPAITILDVDALLKQLRRVLEEVTLAVEYVLFFALLAGFSVLFAAVYTSIDARLFEGVMLRTFGASRDLLRATQWIEFAFLGLLAGLLAAGTVELFAGILYRLVFEMHYATKWQIWLFTPLAGALVVGLAGYACTRSVLRKSPLDVLRAL